MIVLGTMTTKLRNLYTLRWVSIDYFNQPSDLRQHENQFLGLTLAWIRNAD